MKITVILSDEELTKLKSLNPELVADLGIGVTHLGLKPGNKEFTLSDSIAVSKINLLYCLLD